MRAKSQRRNCSESLENEMNLAHTTISAPADLEEHQAACVGTSADAGTMGAGNPARASSLSISGNALFPTVHKNSAGLNPSRTSPHAPQFSCVRTVHLLTQSRRTRGERERHSG